MVFLKWFVILPETRYRSYIYSWTPAGTGTTSDVTVTPGITTTYTVTTTDGCGSPAASNTVTVTLWSLPVINFSASDTAGCTELCINFIDNSSVAGGSLLNGFGILVEMQIQFYKTLLTVLLIPENILLLLRLPPTMAVLQLLPTQI